MKERVHAQAMVKSMDVTQPKPLRSGTALTMTMPFQSTVSDIQAANHDMRLAPVRDAAVSAAPEKRPYASFGKRALDILLVLLCAPVALPLVAICVLALMAEGARPFYKQKRLGFQGKTFEILKLRTMVQDADKSLEAYLEKHPEMRREWDESQKLKKDPRITRLGGFLRSSSLDELPQLWNVLKGDMSLVGPRPMMPEQLPLYGNPKHYFAMLPGITGVWQVSERNESSFAMRNGADETYARSVSLGFDLRLLAKTVGVVLRRTGY
jgi:lipopolysaccharide/colanic/teichoic acid biosynthesis glycosyltransferase